MSHVSVTPGRITRSLKKVEHSRLEGLNLTPRRGEVGTKIWAKDCDNFQEENIDHDPPADEVCKNITARVRGMFEHTGNGDSGHKHLNKSRTPVKSKFYEVDTGTPTVKFMMRRGNVQTPRGRGAKCFAGQFRHLLKSSSASKSLDNESDDSGHEEVDDSVESVSNLMSRFGMPSVMSEMTPINEEATPVSEPLKNVKDDSPSEIKSTPKFSSRLRSAQKKSEIKSKIIDKNNDHNDTDSNGIPKYKKVAGEESVKTPSRTAKILERKKRLEQELLKMEDSESRLGKKLKKRYRSGGHDSDCMEMKESKTQKNEERGPKRCAIKKEGQARRRSLRNRNGDSKTKILSNEKNIAQINSDSEINIQSLTSQDTPLSGKKFKKRMKKVYEEDVPKMEGTPKSVKLNTPEGHHGSPDNSRKKLLSDEKSIVKVSIADINFQSPAPQHTPSSVKRILKSTKKMAVPDMPKIEVTPKYANTPNHHGLPCNSQKKMLSDENNIVKVSIPQINIQSPSPPSSAKRILKSTKKLPAPDVPKIDVEFNTPEGLEWSPDTTPSSSGGTKRKLENVDTEKDRYKSKVFKRRVHFTDIEKMEIDDGDICADNEKTIESVTHLCATPLLRKEAEPEEDNIRYV